MNMARSSRIMIATLAGMAIFTTLSTDSEANPVEGDDVQGLLEEINRSDKISEDNLGNEELRSEALDSALESRSALIRLEETQNDPRRPIWLADQAEALLLRRIEFPSSWSTHLMVAHPSCPLMPPEIPLIVGRGLQEILQAEEVVGGMIEMLESRAGFKEDPELISLHERLQFEMTLRIPLLKSIGLLLAAGADSDSGDAAFEILKTIRDHDDLMDATREIVNYWFRQAVLVTGNEDVLRELATEMKTRPDQTPLERIREASLLEEPNEVIELGRTLIRELERDRSYEKLLLSDVVERSLEMKLADRMVKENAHGWEEGPGDTWIMLLDDSEQNENWTLDGPLATRLLDLERVHGEEGAPLAVLWASGQSELAKRSRDEMNEPRMLAMLQEAVMNAETDEPGRARALETAIRIAMLEEERLTAAELGQILYREHPRHPFGGPRLVADLTEPWARAGQAEAGRRYEGALKDLITDLSAQGQETDISAQILRLAEHHLRLNRPKESRVLLQEFRPSTTKEAARFLDACLQEIMMMLEADTLTDEHVDLEYDLLQRNVERMLGDFGPLDVTLQAAASRARLASISGRKRLPRNNRSRRLVEQIMARDDIPSEIRIDALFLRHKMRLGRGSERAKALESMPELVKAFELNRGLAGRRLTGMLEEQLGLLESLRGTEQEQADQEEIMDEVKSVARLIDEVLISSSSMPERILVGRCFNELGLSHRAIPHWNAMAIEQPDAWVIMKGQADALALSTEFDDQAEAMRLYLRLGQDGPGDNVPERVWWCAQLGQLLMMEKADRSTEKIPTRIERLKLIDPELGGSQFKRKFESLAQRIDQKS
jgi:hypothetical protein